MFQSNDNIPILYKLYWTILGIVSIVSQRETLFMNIITTLLCYMAIELIHRLLSIDVLIQYCIYLILCISCLYIGILIGIYFMINVYN
jgi:hypothetical protein